MFEFFIFLFFTAIQLLPAIKIKMQYYWCFLSKGILYPTSLLKLAEFELYRKGFLHVAVVTWRLTRPLLMVTLHSVNVFFKFVYTCTNYNNFLPYVKNVCVKWATICIFTSSCTNHRFKTNLEKRLLQKQSEVLRSTTLKTRCYINGALNQIKIFATGNV